ncbi:tetratricopeptide repeat protein, partial [Planktomarina sp.]|nr:tetratricopeptide repeat protein [Planktomarina sp.]
IKLYSQGQLQKALEQVTLLLKQYPNSSVLHNMSGVVFNGLGQLDSAVGSYKKALVASPYFAVAYYNMGSALKEQGKLEEAIEAYNNALALKPDNAEAYSNMGLALQDQGKLEEAIEAYNKALAIKPDFAEAHYNIGNALQEQGKLEEAVDAYNRSLALKPDSAAAHNNKGAVLAEQDKLEEAIEAYNKALAIKPDYAEAYYNMGNALKGVVFKKQNSKIQKAIVTILNHNTYVRPKDISPAAISLLKFEPVFQQVLQRQSKGQLIQSLQETVLNLSKLPLLLKLMAVCPLANLELEDLFRDIRFGLLFSISELESSSEVLHFQSALALQCFTNEYVYEVNDTENKAIQALEVLMVKLLGKGQQPSPQSILCLASYKALHEYEWCDLLTATHDIEEVFTRQIMEPKQEANMKSDIPALKEIINEVSAKVREQYESNPYPRWINLGLPFKPLPISKLVDEVKLRLFDNTINEVEAPDILIAGCGTGQHSIGTAARFKGSNVLAIDLSLSSLSYAKRKTEELGIQNIDYTQADILDLGKLGRRFDIVESAGVLHHMDDPLAGWRVLTDCLRTGGLMKIGLYSELARQPIVEMRGEISNARIGSSEEEMKSFRTMVINSDQNYSKAILNTSNFYSLSELRDLLFHVKEHRFTIPRIKNCLTDLGLKFCGFENAKLVQNFKLNNTDADDPYDLDKWHAYEEANPNVFIGMYQFWCQKVG